MPLVNVRILEGQSEERKAEMARRITAAIVDVAGVPEASVFVVFEDIRPAEPTDSAEAVRQSRTGS